MSKDQKKTIEIPVETVEKLWDILNWITTTITFWKLQDKWPTNLIQDTVDECCDMLSDYKQELAFPRSQF